MSSARRRRITAIIGKDLRSFSRDRFLLLITIIAIIFYVVVFYLLPKEVDETVRIGVHHPDEVEIPALLAVTPGLELVEFDSREALAAAVADRDQELMAGIAIPANLKSGGDGAPIHVEVFVDARTPAELHPLIASMVRELAYLVIGETLPVTLPELDKLVVGDDKLGDQSSPRDKFGSLLALMILALEMIALGSLVAKEVQSRTVTALLVTPTTTFDVLCAKAIFGTGLAALQAVVVLVAIGALMIAPAQFLVLIFLGALMFTGFGMVAGSRGGNFTEVLMWVMLFMIPAMVPAIAALFPGSTSSWVKLFPTYPLAVALDGAAAGASFATLAPSMAALALWDLVIFTIGWIILARRVRAL